MTQENLGPAAAYLAQLSPGSRPAQESALRTIVGMHCLDRETIHSFAWAEMTASHVEAVRNLLVDGKYKPATANRILAALRGVLTECWRQESISAERLARIKDVRPVPGAREKKGRALTREEVRNLLYHARGLRDRVLLRLMIEAGLRRDEVRSLRWKDLSIGEVRVTGKGNKERRVPISSSLWSQVVVYGTSSLPVPATQPYVFGGNRPLSYSRIWQIVQGAAARAELGPVTPHDLRRTFASRLLDSGIDLAMVQKLMGHSDPKITARYDKRSTKEVRQRMEAIFDV